MNDHKITTLDLIIFFGLIAVIIGTIVMNPGCLAVNTMPFPGDKTYSFSTYDDLDRAKCSLPAEVASSGESK